MMLKCVGIDIGLIVCAVTPTIIPTVSNRVALSIFIDPLLLIHRFSKATATSSNCAANLLSSSTVSLLGKGDLTGFGTGLSGISANGNSWVTGVLFMFLVREL